MSKSKKAEIRESLNQMMKFNEMKNLHADYRMKIEIAIKKYNNAKTDKERLHYQLRYESLYDQANAAAAVANTIATEITTDYDKIQVSRKQEAKFNFYASCAIIGLVITGCVLGMILKRTK